MPDGTRRRFGAHSTHFRSSRLSTGPALSVHWSDYVSMRDLSQDASPSLFDAPPSSAYLHAKDFVRWCCSFGPDFRNSPDVTNLRYWAQKTKVHIEEREVVEVLETARPLFLKRIEQGLRKAARAERTEALN